MSKTEFTALKQKIQNFQREKFPELSRSVVEHGRREKTLQRNVTQAGKEVALSDTEYQIKRRTGRVSDKEKLIEMLENCYKKANSKEDFFERMRECGAVSYIRGGKVSGVVYGRRKFRLKRIGFAEERLEELEVEIKRISDIQQLRQASKVHRKNIEKIR